MRIDSQSLYMQLGALIESMPVILPEQPFPDEKERWLARAYALIAALNLPVEELAFRQAVRNLHSRTTLAHDAPGVIKGCIYRAFAVAELRAPASIQGAFIPAGSPFDAMAAVAKVLRQATRQLLIVDPYLDERVLTDFMPLAAENVSIRLLADQADHKASLRPAASRWVQQYGSSRPLEVKLAPAKALHDRLIVVDDGAVWLLTQSFNGIAARSPATIVRVEGDAAVLKLAAFGALWATAAPI